MNPALRHALAYAKAGWPVFPCLPGGKAPDTPHGFKDAATDPVIITRWWERHPGRNVAIRTGAPGPDVLDIDIKADGDGYGALARLKRARLTGNAQGLVMTRSRGLHCYFTGSTQGCGSLPRHYLDFKATGGYVLAPPSFVEADDRGPAGPYQLLDYRPAAGGLDWQAVKRFLEPPREHGPRPVAGMRRPDSLAAWVARLPEGNRNNGLYWAARQAIDNGITDLTAILTAAISAGLPEAEAQRTIASAQRGAA